MFMTIQELAAELGMPLQTVRHWRLNGYGPRAARIGRRVLYRRADVQAGVNAEFDEAS